MRSTAPVVVRRVSTSVSGSVSDSLTASMIRLGRRGRALRGPAVALERLGLGADVEQQLTEIDGLHAVDQRLVRLVEQGDVAIGEALDEVDLPQRAAAVERPRHDPGRQLAQLVERAGTWQGGAAYVVAEVELLVIDPDRVGHARRACS